MNDLHDLLAGTLNIGVTYSFSPILTETLLDFMKLYPGVKLNIFYKPVSELMAMLTGREVDFVLAFRPRQAVEGIESHILFQNYLAAIVNPGHPLASQQSVTLDELSRYDLALPTRGLQARNYFDAVSAARATTCVSASSSTRSTSCSNSSAAANSWLCLPKRRPTISAVSRPSGSMSPLTR